MSVIEQIFFLPPMAVARLGGSDVPLESFVWVEDPATHGGAATVIQPSTTLLVKQNGSIQPTVPSTIQFRDGAVLRPVAPFFELWAAVRGSDDPVPLTTALLAESGGSLGAVTYTVSAANRKAARRTGDESCAFAAQIHVAGDDHGRHSLFASGMGAQPLVLPERPIPLGRFQVIRPAPGMQMGVDLSVLRVRFTPAKGEVYGPPGASSGRAPDTNREHQIVAPANRILNPNASWLEYDANERKFNSPVPADTYDGADRGNQRSLGVVDDTCDALIEAVVVAGGARLRAVARVFCAPPDFAPDRRPFVSLADDLIDRDSPAAEAEESLDDSLKRLADLFQRVFETVSLANVDAMRDRSIGGGQPDGRTSDKPRTDDASMTPRDTPYYQPTLGEIPPPTPEARLPFVDKAQEVHSPLAEADDLARTLREKSDLIRRLIRPPYGAFKDLRANPGTTPNPAHRDVRIARDRLHDMRMPPYMLDSDATALSLSRRQYDFLMALLAKLEVKRGKKPVSQPLPTATNAHKARVLERRAKRQPPSTVPDAPAVEAVPRRGKRRQ
jgi:hypothetical protein